MRMRRVGLCFAVIAAIFISNGSSVRAAPDFAQGLQISPVVIDLNADKGKNYNLKLSILNVTSGDLVFKVIVNDFKAKDESGTPQVLLDNNLPPSSSIVSWIAPISPVSLKSKETKTLIIPINIPANAESGGHYGVIRFSGTAPQLQNTGVALAASAGPLLLVRVSGQITEKLDLKEFFTSRGTKPTSLFSNSPITFVERINNTGNVHVKPQGDLVVKSMFGKTVGTLKVNGTNGNVLPDSIRRFEQTLNKKWMFGKYTARLNLAYGTKGQILAGSTTFWVIPFKIIAAILIALIILILILRSLIKRYNRWVVHKAGGKTPPSNPPPAAPVISRPPNQQPTQHRKHKIL